GFRSWQSWTEGDSGHWQSAASPPEATHLLWWRYVRGRPHALRMSPFPTLSAAFPDGFAAAGNHRRYRSCASCAFVPEPYPTPYRDLRLVLSLLIPSLSRQSCRAHPILQKGLSPAASFGWTDQ